MSDQTQPLRIRPLAGAARDARPPQVTGEAVTTVASDTEIARVVGAHPVAFPGYEILGEIGRGGMGVVYKARQRNLNRLVALKVILSGPHASPEDKARFHIEAEAGARLHHPNIVQVYDVGEHAGFSYIALELIEGSTLRKWQDSRPVEPQLAARLALVLARAVQHAHEHGIIHRDLKPANILLPGGVASAGGAASNGPATSLTKHQLSASSGTGHDTPTLLPRHLTPKVTDFGLAKAIQGGADLTITGMTCGTPNYMAPEQIRGGQRQGPSVDVYGLGAVLYELLTGWPPFTGSDAVQVMDRILKSAPPGVRRLAPGLPRDLAVIVAKCLEKDAARRYLTLSDLADDLERFVTGRPILARPVGVIEQGWRWVRRNPVPTAFLALLSAGCLITGGLATALARSEAVEHAARSEAEQAQSEAIVARTLAEASRDELQTAFAATEAARKQAEQERGKADTARCAADLEKAHALQLHEMAEVERKKAEGNLKIARAVIRTTLNEFSRDPRFEAPEFHDFRVKLIASVRTFRNEVAAQGRDTIEWLDDLADMSHWLGFLEYLNDDQPQAAAEYLAAAGAACKWVAADPDDPEPRSRMADSLVNAGNALYNHRRYAEAEASYRHAVRVIESVMEISPRVANYRRVAYQAHAQLANQLQITGRVEEQVEAAQAALAHARELTRRNGESVENLRTLAAGHAELAQAHMRQRKWDDAERCFGEGIAIRERICAGNPESVRYAGEFTAAVLTLAESIVKRGDPQRAGPQFHRAVRHLEIAADASPQSVPLTIQLADAYTRHAEALRFTLAFPEAESRYDQALGQLAPVLVRSPKSTPVRDSWARAMTGRAHLYNRTGRHRDAADEWAKLAEEDPDVHRRIEADLFVCQSLLFANDWRMAASKADALSKRQLPAWMCYELARVWCLVSKQAANDESLGAVDRVTEAEKAIARAVAQLEKGKAAGLFKEERFVHLVATNPDLALVRGKFDPRQ